MKIFCALCRENSFELYVLDGLLCHVFYTIFFSVIKGFGERFEKKICISHDNVKRLRVDSYFGKWLFSCCFCFAVYFFVWRERFNCSWRVLFHYRVSKRPNNFPNNSLSLDLLLYIQWARKRSHQLKKKRFFLFCFNIYLFFFFL